MVPVLLIYLFELAAAEEFVPFIGNYVGLKKFLLPGMTMTYDSDIKHGHIATESGYTYGGYSGSQTVNHK